MPKQRQNDKNSDNGNSDNGNNPGYSKQEQLNAFRDPTDQEPLTTDQGVHIPHTDDSLKVGERGPSLLEDFHLREKITHFDHERIPERVVHARGSGAHGVFRVYESLADLTKADFLQDPSVETPVFVRFSTVLGSRGAADTTRDVRGFATKFYTRDGNFDLVGNNMPVFFIQDAIKFPDLVHAAKPEPHDEIPQGATAHDTFWDFISLMPESMHVIMWALSDRGIPRSFRMMEGFGVHTFGLVNARGERNFVKFHWKPLLGVHSLVWDEATKISGKDPDFHRRDLWSSIDSGAFPEYEFGIQVMPEADAEKYPFDILDATKIWPEELIPVRRIGKMTLNRNPDNFFAETEQAAFHTANLVPGIEPTNDPLLQGRNFSYLDTQINRFNGTNFSEVPINRPIAAVHNHQTDGYMRQRIHQGRVAYFPSSLGDGGVQLAPPDEHSYRHYPEPVSGTKMRGRPEKFKDYFSQARLYWNSLTEYEQQHLVDAAHFELGHVETKHVRERMVALFSLVDEALAQRVAAGIGVTPPRGQVEVRDAAGDVLHRVTPPVHDGVWVESSPSLSMANQPRETIVTRRVAILVGEGVDGTQLEAVRSALLMAGGTAETIGEVMGPVKAADGSSVEVQRAGSAVGSVLYDAVFVPGGKHIQKLLQNGDALHFVNEAYKHGKPIGVLGEGVQLLERASIPRVSADGVNPQAAERLDAGIIAVTEGSAAKAFAETFIRAIAQHRFPLRPNLAAVPA
jgi:catalase